MKIADVTSTIVNISRSRDLATAYGVSTGTNTVVVQVRTDDGITGIGQTVAPAPWGGDAVEVVKHQIDQYLAPALTGEDPFNIERLHITMFQALRPAVNARTALDFALWDIKGKALGVPVYQLLGGACMPGAVCHGFVERDEPQAMAARIEALNAEGWTWFKTKIGFTVDEDVMWYSQLLDLVGDNIRFQLDGNTGYTLGDAVHALTQLERLGGVALFEQPVEHLDEMAHLATRLATPLQADESTGGGPRGVFEIARERAAHVLHFKIHRYGGLLPSARMAAIAEAAGLEISIAPYFDVIAAAAAHLATATPVAKWPAGFSDMTDTILAEPYEPDGIILKAPDGPGLGVQIDEDKLAYFAAST
ncbi:MAG: mandelate racemase/muconate lactonizing enzyme family protein [Chloroflexi bacterium]|nr:mandelate racemase/muconate lactonizing enzyme family protein [Chloroflexota bacterium]MCY3917203.1 mandelate racemase/muconate lactonizing enzyme family protein [Chloroflexota bacterium]